MPDIEAEKCWVRIADASDLSLISQSGPFSIGKEEITLLNPKGGEKLCANKRFVIAWNYKNIANTKLLVQYAIGSASWQNISSGNGVDPWVSVFGFTPPSQQTDSLRIRVVSKNEASIVAISPYLTLSNEADCIATSVEDDINKLTIMIAPNPINGNVFTITINASTQCHIAQLTLTDINGSMIHDFGKEFTFAQGIHTLSLQIPPLASGKYFLTLYCNGKTTSVPVTIEK
jgi:hypothetical protein